MRDMVVSDGRLGLVNRLLAVIVAVCSCGAMLTWGVPGLDPALWEEVSVVAGLRPPQTVFPGFWRTLAGWLFPLFGTDRALSYLNLAGVLAGGVCVYLVYMIVRQILSLVIRVGHPYRVWYGFIAPFFAVVAALSFGLSEPFWRITRTFSPEVIRLFLFLSVVHVLMRWFVDGGRWRLFPAVALAGAMAAETPFAFLLPLAFLGAYAGVWHCVMDGLFPKPEKLPEPEAMPKWRMLFLFLGGLAVAAWLNATAFTSLGGIEANGWEPSDIYFHYVCGYWHVMADAASLIGWILGIVFAVLPFFVALRIAPMVIRDDRPMPFNLGVLMFFIGLLAVMQTGAFPSMRFWTFMRGTPLVGSGFLLVFFIFCAMAMLAIFGASFAFECQRTSLTEEEGKRPGLLLKGVVPFLTVGLVALTVFRLHKPIEVEMQKIVDEAVREVVTECGDAKWIFTDGTMDAAIELESHRRGRRIYPFNMMSGASEWEVNLMRRCFTPDTADYRAAETGVPVLMRVWAGEKTNGMDGVALQLGFEFWRRDRKPLPRASGMVARQVGMSEEEAKAGIERAKALTKHILEIAPAVEKASPSSALANAYSAVCWRLSRFARLREDVQTAVDLDNSNGILKEMIGQVEKERVRAFLQMTPREGLQIALRRANFAEARRYATVVLANDEENPEANFAMAMNAISINRLDDAERYLRTCLRVRPREPAVINNLSIVCRKLGKYKEAVEFARKADELLPGTPEIKRTLEDALKKAP